MTPNVSSPDRPLSASQIMPDPNRAPRRAYDTAGPLRFLKTHPASPALVYLPLGGYWLWQSYQSPGFVGSTWLLFVAGLAFWTLLEYGIHRGLLHFADVNALWNMGLARIHGAHHEHPEDVSQVIISPLQTLPLCGVLWLLMLSIFSAPHADGMLAGVAAGYLAYETFHYAFHAPQPLSWRWLNALRKYHARHHFETPAARFGVTTPLWDLVFGT